MTAKPRWRKVKLVTVSQLISRSLPNRLNRAGMGGGPDRSALTAKYGVWRHSDGKRCRRPPRMPKSRRKKKPPKRSLALPDLEQTKSAVLNTLTSKSGQRTYDHAINEFVDWYCSEPRLAFNRTVVLRYRIHLEQRHLAPTTINLRLAAVRRVAYEAADSGLLSPELAAGIRRVKGIRRIGVRLGNWLTAEQGRSLLLKSDQIQFLLGHVSIQTTEHYLGCKQKLRVAVNDKIGIEP